MWRGERPDRRLPQLAAARPTGGAAGQAPALDRLPVRHHERPILWHPLRHQLCPGPLPVLLFTGARPAARLLPRLRRPRARGPRRLSDPPADRRRGRHAAPRARLASLRPRPPVELSRCVGAAPRGGFTEAAVKLAAHQAGWRAFARTGAGCDFSASSLSSIARSKLNQRLSGHGAVWPHPCICTSFAGKRSR